MTSLSGESPSKIPRPPPQSSLTKEYCKKLGKCCRERNYLFLPTEVCGVARKGSVFLSCRTKLCVTQITWGLQSVIHQALMNIHPNDHFMAKHALAHLFITERGNKKADSGFHISYV